MSEPVPVASLSITRPDAPALLVRVPLMVNFDEFVKVIAEPLLIVTPEITSLVFRLTFPPMVTTVPGPGTPLSHRASVLQSPLPLNCDVATLLEMVYEKLSIINRSKLLDVPVADILILKLLASKFPGLIMFCENDFQFEELSSAVLLITPFSPMLDAVFHVVPPSKLNSIK